ncbi:hypothetical protein BDW59DRAFT_141801 [Aspergillus cavernicola]|uniref:F-box domain-containing protein n=1 Tax=Aspergillus cavernicola TaxID=176166 RepID=A0ABR4IPT5_9EURO
MNHSFPRNPHLRLIPRAQLDRLLRAMSISNLESLISLTNLPGHASFTLFRHPSTTSFSTFGFFCWQLLIEIDNDRRIRFAGSRLVHPFSLLTASLSGAGLPCSRFSGRELTALAPC